MHKFVLPLIAVMLLAAGCQQGPKIQGPPKVAQRVVSLSPGLSEIVTVYGNTKLLVGRTASCNYPSYVGSAEVVMTGIKPDYEKIASVKPDLVIYDSKILSEADMAKFGELGIKTFELNANNVADFEKQVVQLGALIGIENRVSEYIDKIEAARAQVRIQKPDPAPTVMVIMPGDGSEHMVCGTKSFLAQIIQECGAKMEGPESDKFEMLNAETLVANNPDILFVAGEPGLIVQDARFANLKAKKNGKIIGINPDVALRKGSRVDALYRSVSNVLTGRIK